MANYISKKTQSALLKIKEGKLINDLRIRNVSPEIVLLLHNIADNKGIDFNIFMKLELKKITEAYSNKLKENPKEN